MAEKRKHDSKKEARIKYSMRKSMADFGDEKRIYGKRKGKRSKASNNGNFLGSVNEKQQSKMKFSSMGTSLPTAISAVSYVNCICFYYCLSLLWFVYFGKLAHLLIQFGAFWR